MKLRFADCRFDTDARRLFRGDREVHLSPKAFEMLTFLVENRHRALSKDDILERVWSGVSVSDASLARVVNEIRQGVGDRARAGRVVRTVHAYGYAFVADVEEEEPRAPAARGGRFVCWLIKGDRTFPLPDGEHLVGREPQTSVWLDSPRVSRRHARIVVENGRATVEDLGSKNGTFVGGRRLDASTPLTDGDEVRIGPFTLAFRIAPGKAPTETEA